MAGGGMEGVRELPGLIYDPVTGRYYAPAPSGTTAPGTAAWARTEAAKRKALAESPGSQNPWDQKNKKSKKGNKTSLLPLRSTSADQLDGTAGAGSPARAEKEVVKFPAPVKRRLVLLPPPPPPGQSPAASRPTSRQGAGYSLSSLPLSRQRPAAVGAQLSEEQTSRKVPSRAAWSPNAFLGPGLFARQINGLSGTCTADVSAARMAEDMVLRSWAAGLVEKGVVLTDEENERKTDGGLECVITDFWIGDAGERREGGLGVVYATFEGYNMVGAQYLPRDEHDRIDFDKAKERYNTIRFRPTYYELPDPVRPESRTVSLIDYHEPSSTILMGAKEAIRWFHPRTEAASETTPTWALPSGVDGLVDIKDSVPGGNNPRKIDHINAILAAPSGSPLLCVVGAHNGILQLRPDNNYPATWITPPPPMQGNHQSNWKASRGGGGYRGRGGYGGRGGHHSGHHHHQQNNSTSTPTWDHGNVLSLDFAPDNPSLLFAGTRRGLVTLFDLRMASAARNENNLTQTLFFKHPSSAAHTRCVGPYNVLVAGPQNAMAVYDIRFLKRQIEQRQQQIQSSKGGGINRTKNNTLPILTFPDYRNDAHVLIGLDVLTTVSYGSRFCWDVVNSRASTTHLGRGGIVAAAHGDGTINLYSLTDGTRIAASRSAEKKILHNPRGVVRKLRWATLNGDRHPSLFCSRGTEVVKISFERGGDE